MTCLWFTVCVCLYLSVIVNCQISESQEVELPTKRKLDDAGDNIVLDGANDQNTGEDSGLDKTNDKDADEETGLDKTNDKDADEDTGLDKTNDQEADEDNGLDETNDQEANEETGLDKTNDQEADEETGLDKTNDQEADEDTGLDKTNDQEAEEDAGLDKTNDQEADEDAGLDETNDQEAEEDAGLDKSNDQEAEEDAGLDETNDQEAEEDAGLDKSNDQEAEEDAGLDDAKDDDEDTKLDDDDGENASNGEEMGASSEGSEINKSNRLPLAYNANSALEDELGTREIKEMQAGHPSDVFPSNPHRAIPQLYTDFSRRFVLQYPYDDGNVKKVEEVEDALEKAVKIFQSKNDRIKVNLAPVKAPPELVLAVAKQSQLVKPKASQNDKLLVKEGLRNGEYWNALWKEDVNPDILRTQDSEYTLPQLKNENRYLRSIKVQLDPKAELYDLMSILKDHSPRLLYVINTNSDNNKQ